MGKVTTDIDIDFANRDAALVGMLSIPASMTTQGNRAKHPTGVYFQNIPVDPLDDMASLNYEEAAENGYFKIDFLNNSLYNDVRDEQHLIKLINDEPMWDLLAAPGIVEELAHIKTSFNIVNSIKPRSVEDLAVVLALMRPGKRHLLNLPRDEINARIWKAEDNGFIFKRAHAIAYAVSIVVQLNLMCEKMAEEIDSGGLEREKQEREAFNHEIFQ
jgi:hypothetical protein